MAAESIQTMGSPVRGKCGRVESVAASTRNEPEDEWDIDDASALPDGGQLIPSNTLTRTNVTETRPTKVQRKSTGTSVGSQQVKVKDTDRWKYDATIIDPTALRAGTHTRVDTNDDEEAESVQDVDNNDTTSPLEKDRHTPKQKKKPTGLSVGTLAKELADEGKDQGETDGCDSRPMIDTTTSSSIPRWHNPIRRDPVKSAPSSCVSDPVEFLQLKIGDNAQEVSLKAAATASSKRKAARVDGLVKRRLVVRPEVEFGVGEAETEKDHAIPNADDKAEAGPIFISQLAVRPTKLQVQLRNLGPKIRRVSTHSHMYPQITEAESTSEGNMMKQPMRGYCPALAKHNLVCATLTSPCAKSRPA